MTSDELRTTSSIASDLDFVAADVRSQANQASDSTRHSSFVIRHFSWVVFVIALGLYWGSTRPFGGTYSPVDAYYNLQSAAWLDGRLNIPNKPGMATWDLTRHERKWYVAFPPLPSILLLPEVALNGLEATDTIRLSVVLGALNVALVFATLQGVAQRGWTTLKTGDNLWLTVLFGLGTVHWYMALQGTVWFLAQVSAFTFLGLATVSALRTKSAWLTGALVAAAMLARPHVVLIMPFLLAIVWLQWAREARTVGAAVRWLAKAAVPVLAAVLALFAYNDARFGDWRDFGYLTQNVNDLLVDDLAEYGQFHPHFLSRNLKAMVWATPQVDDELGGSLWPDRWGMSLFLVTPPLLWLLGAVKRSWLVLGAWTAVGLILIPLLTYYNTGWWQFGYRFSLDFMLPIMVLLAVAVGRRVPLLMKVLIVVSIFINAWGAVWFAMITGRFG